MILKSENELYDYKTEIDSAKNFFNQRNNLEILKNTPTFNSNLKKKINIINKIKNISTTDFEELFISLKMENLKNFYKEIINNLIIALEKDNIKLENIYKITKIIYFYSSDDSFIKYLTASLKKIYFKNWALGSIFIETYYLINLDKENFIKKFGSVIKNILKKNKNNDLINLIYYLLKSFNFSENIFSIIKENFIYSEENKHFSVDEKNIDILNFIKKSLEIECQFKIPLDYKEVITENLNEFIFYDLNENYEKEKFEIKKIETLLLENFNNVAILDEIAALELISIKKIFKLKNKICLLPALARISTKIKFKNQVVSKTLNNLKTINDHIFLLELFKFNNIKTKEYFFYLNNLLKNIKKENQINEETEIISEILYRGGRFLLINKNTNFYMRKFLDKLENINFNHSEKLKIENSINYIYKKEIQIDFIEYLKFLINEKNFLNNDENKNIIKNNKYLLSLIFLQPKFFNNNNLLVNNIINIDFLFLEEIFLNSLSLTLKYSKNTFYNYIDILSKIKINLDKENAEKTIFTIYSKIKEFTNNLDVLIKSLIIILENLYINENVIKSVKSENKINFINENINFISFQTKSSFFTLCKKYNLKIEEKNNSNELFLKEIEYLSNL